MRGCEYFTPIIVYNYQLHLGSKALLFQTAAESLLNNVESAVLERLENNPEGYEPVPSKKQRDYPYYRIYVGNYIIYYVVIPEGKERIMEVRRFTHTLQKREHYL